MSHRNSPTYFGNMRGDTFIRHFVRRYNLGLLTPLQVRKVIAKAKRKWGDLIRIEYKE